MRDIRFRAWSIERKTMLQVGDAFGTEHPLDCCVYKMQGQNVVLMQFTGLTDKNGKGIYEGDIVVVPPGYRGDRFYSACNAIIKYDAPEFLAENPSDKYGVTEQDFDWSKIEVIGNIYENPELLK